MLTCVAETGAPASTDIVYVADISGSVDTTDSGQYIKDALKLGVDLAPANSRVAVVAFNYEIISETELTDVSVKEGREFLKGYVSRLSNTGSTDFSTGLNRAVELLEASGASEKRIIFLGDFSEGGYNAGSDEAEAANAVDNLAARAKNNNIAIDMLFWETAPQASVAASHFKDASEATGGRFLELANPNQLPGAVEDIYFQNYSYLHTITGIRGESAHILNIPMPTPHVKRARVYVSAKSPAVAFSASYSGGSLDGEQNRSYAIIDLEQPSQEGVSLTLTPGENGDASVYLLLEYDIKISASVVNETELKKGEKEYTQTARIRAEIVDSQTGTPLLTAPYGDAVTYTVNIHTPSGAVLSEYETGDPVTYTFLPAEFGKYTVSAQLKAGGIALSPAPVAVDVRDIRPVIEPVNWPLYLAIGIACALVLAALIFAFRHRKKEAVHQGAVEMASDYRFHGKLSVYAVMLDGGNRELPPFDFGMYGMREKRITLREILDSGGARGVYPGSENILILVGPEESLIVRNNSQAVIRVMGREYGYQTKFQLFYRQKMYIIFRQDEDELEMSYRQTREEAAVPVRFHVGSRQG